MADNTPPGDMVVRVSELPTAESIDFCDTQFFLQHNCALPPPAEVRQKATAIHATWVRTQRPPPVVFEEKGLIVKYGSEITIAEGQCLWYFNRFMKNKVPTPELFGWRVDDGQTFIYMELIPGETLEEAWSHLDETEIDDICKQLRDFVGAWRGLRQESEPYFIGEIFPIRLRSIGAEVLLAKEVNAHSL
jgi:hypothetical protein